MPAVALSAWREFRRVSCRAVRVMLEPVKVWLRLLVSEAPVGSPVMVIVLVASRSLRSEERRVGEAEGSSLTLAAAKLAVNVGVSGTGLTVMVMSWVTE